MSSHRRQFIPFQAFEPDTVDFDNPKLDVAENVTPSYGAYRPIEKLVVVASVTDSNPLRGGYAHLSGQSNPVIKVSPLGTPVGANVGNWYTKDLENIEGPDVTDYGVTFIGGPGVDDTTWVRSPAIAENSPTKAVWFLFATTPRVPVTSGGDDEVTLRIRVRAVRDLGSGIEPKLDYTLYDTSTLDTIKTGTFVMAATHTDDWQDFSYVLTDLEVDDVDDWSTLELKIEPYFDTLLPDLVSQVVPVADEYFDTGWEADDGENTEMFDHINGTGDGFPALPDYDVFIDSPYVANGEDSTVIFKMEQVELPSDPDFAIPSFGVYVTGTANNVSVKLRVVQGAASEDADDTSDGFWLFSDQNFVVLAEGETTSISTDQVTPTLTTVTASPETSAAWIEAVDPSKAVYIAVTVTYAGDEENVGSVELQPDAESGSGWGGFSTGDLGDGSDATYVSGVFVPQPKSSVFNLASGSSRSADTDHVISYRAKTNTGADGLTKVELWHDTAGLIAHTGSFRTITDSFVTYNKTIGTGAVNNIPEDGYDGLYFKLYGAAAASATIHVSELTLTYPGDSAKGRVYEAWGNVGHSDRFEFSHAILEIVDPAKTNVGDFNNTYVGTDTDLYEVTPFGFTDFTRAGDDYGDESTDTPRLWSFTSWGDDVIATNYADEVQKLGGGGTKFVDLISGTYIPQARFCAVIGGHLVLADINPASFGYTDGKPYHLWCSNLLDPTTFDPADYDNQSAIFPLISKPGAITGLVGGEYGWVFKRNSVWRMTYVGLPPIFQFDMVIEGVGCSHPQSIVSAGGDVYFWGGGAIHRIGPQGYQRLSGQRIEKYIFDTSYESNGLKNVYSNDSRENDGVVWGAFDAYSGLIWWLYRTTNDEQDKINNVVCYSVIEDRFTTIQDDTLDLSLILAQQNVATDEPVLNRSLQAFRYADTATEYVKFIDDDTYAGSMKTKIITPSSWGSQVGRDAEITMVRPMYIAQPDQVSYGSTELPNFTITITGAQDPTLRIGKQTRVVDRVRENRQGWIPIQPVTAEFWQFEVTVPELYRATVKEFLGLQLMTREAGDG